MGREVKTSLLVPNCTAQVYHRIVYEDAEAARQYHKQLSAGGDVDVQPWEDNCRIIGYSLPVKVPAILKSAIGVDTISVKEHQCISWQGAACFTITSSPSMNFPGSSKFKTVATTQVSDNDNGCLVEVVLNCTAALPWGLQGTVESLMETEAREAIDKFLQFTKQRVAASSQPPVIPHTPPQEEEEQPPTRRSMAGTMDEFFDVGDGFAETTVVSSCLRDISQSLATTARVLEAMDRTMNHINAHLTTLSSQRQQANGLLCLLLGAAVGVGATCAYMRHRSTG